VPTPGLDDNREYEREVLTTQIADHIGGDDGMQDSRTPDMVRSFRQSLGGL